jgi:hypothetical protein
MAGVAKHTERGEQRMAHDSAPGAEHRQRILRDVLRHGAAAGSRQGVGQQPRHQRGHRRLEIHNSNARPVQRRKQC